MEAKQKKKQEWCGLVVRDKKWFRVTFCEKALDMFQKWKKIIWKKRDAIAWMALKPEKSSDVIYIPAKYSKNGVH